MQTYAAVDLHSNDGFLAIIDETDRVLKQRKLPNRLERFVEELEPYRATLQGVAVKSTFNWYWLVDGLQAKDFPVVLVNTSAIQQYSGFKHSDDLLYATPPAWSFPAPVVARARRPKRPALHRTA